MDAVITPNPTASIASGDHASKKECSPAIMLKGINNYIDRKRGKGWMFVHAVRIEADFPQERDEDKTSVNLSRLMVFPARDKWVFTSRDLLGTEDFAFRTSLCWADDEIKTACDSGE